MSTARQQAARAIVVSLSAREYHTRPGVSNSMLGSFLASPRIFQAVHILREAQEDRESSALDLGTGEHAWVFEPSKFADYISVIPEEVLSKRGAREGEPYKAWLAEQGDKVTLKENDWWKIKSMRRALYANNAAAELLGAAQSYEQTITWTCPETGLLRRSRLDCITRSPRGAPRIVDLKTAADHSPEAFARSCLKWGYHRQSEFYRDAYEAAFGERPGFVFIVVRSEPPHVARCYSLGESEAALGKRQISDALVDLAERYAHDRWAEPGEDSISEVCFKPWAFRED